MAAKIIDGKAVAAKVKEEVKAACAKLKEERGLIPKLVVIQVGDMGPSTIYVRNKKKACEQVGIESEIWHLPDTITQDELLDKIEKCNQDDSIHGVLVQLPLPAHLDETACTNAICPDKDALRNLLFAYYYIGVVRNNTNHAAEEFDGFSSIMQDSDVGERMNTIIQSIEYFIHSYDVVADLVAQSGEVADVDKITVDQIIEYSKTLKPRFDNRYHRR